ncbi:DNA cytosine methyltransferase [Mycoplasma sp. HU2014]|uniref:DNA cytosine methyltransferase n=1 Tax=Mycoplasma sp. HU2014 TaxID=1664275 RepID=UPI00067CD956|nr:DNA cytosine methyltransferase [Mycoplasma sp. HU2014]KNG79770.1 putative methyltransferase [Mycoplasma sp. HU2014]
MVIWALFDDGQMSYYNALKDFKEVKIYSIGINKKPGVINIDLSIQNPNLIKELEKLPAPDIILASPPCESWSIADNQQKMLTQTKSHYWVLRNKSWYKNHNNTCKPNLKRDFYKRFATTLNGFSTSSATIKIIETFQPKAWVIENPQSSKIWEYLHLFLNWYHINNLTYYNNYDKEYSLKPTIFKSNVELNLKHKRIKTKQMIHIHGYDRRSSIPKELIIDIYQQIKNSLTNQNSIKHKVI